MNENAKNGSRRGKDQTKIIPKGRNKREEKM